MGAIACVALIAIAVLAIDAGTGPGGSPRPAATHSQASHAYGELPLSFQPNRGQSDHRVRFLSQGAGYGLFLTRQGAVLSLSPRSEGVRRARSASLSMRLLGANADPPISGARRLPGRVNYLIGRDRSRWQTDVPTFAAVRYSAVWPGIGMTFYGNQRHLEYDFELSPGADVRAIGLLFDGQRQIRIDRSGDLVLDLGGQSMRQLRPVAYQVVGGRRKSVSSRYVLRGDGRVGLRVGAYDHARPLVIDPQLVYSTYLGGSGRDASALGGVTFRIGDGATGVALDSAGNAYVAGQALSPDFPTTAGSVQPTEGTIFVAKLGPSGGLLYSTYLSILDPNVGAATAGGIDVDWAGNAYIVGSGRVATTPGAFRTTGPGVFVSKLNPTGTNLVYSTYLGGGRASGVAIDSSSHAYITGIAASDFPTTAGAFQTNGPGAFVTKLNPSGSGLVYSTYLGGSSPIGDEASGIAVDLAGHAFITGTAFTTDFPVTPGALQTSNRAAGQGGGNAFVTKLNPGGTGIAYSTYLGGSYNTNGTGIAIDSAGNSYVTGSTSSDFPTTAGAFQTVYPGSAPGAPGGPTGFVSKLNPAGTGLVYSTYLGGPGGASGAGIAVDSTGNVYVAGDAISAGFLGAIPSDFPTTPGAFQTVFPGTVPGVFDTSGFLAKLNATGSELVYSTYLGGSGDCGERRDGPACGIYGDQARGVAIDQAGKAYVVGWANSTDFPTTPGAFQSVNRNVAGDRLNYLVGPNAFITMVDPPNTTPGQPIAATSPASDVSGSAARINGFVDPNGALTTYRFEYGASTAYGLSTPEQDAGTGTTSQRVSATLAGLESGTTYHFRVIAISSLGTTVGADQSFIPKPVVPARPTITSGPRGRTRNRKPVFRFWSSEPHASFRCRLDQQSYRECSSPHRLRRLSYGRHTFRVRAVSRDGVPGPAARRIFKVVR